MTTLTRLGAVVCAGTLLLSASACGSTPEQSADQAPVSGSESAPGATRGGMPGFPGAQGEIAAIDGNTAQVQNQQTGQVAVTWNADTAFTRQVAAKLADVEVGSCVMVRTSGSDSDAEPETGDASTVAAATVRITEPVEGACTGGFGGTGRGGAPPSGMPSPPEGMERPDGARPDRPDRPDRPGGASGAVTAVSEDGFTVTSQRPGGEDTGTVTVAVSAATTYTREAEGSAADIKVGSCATARGQADDTGAITAETIALSPKEDGTCGMLLMRGGPRPGASDQAQES